MPNIIGKNNLIEKESANDKEIKRKKIEEERRLMMEDIKLRRNKSQ